MHSDKKGHNYDSLLPKVITYRTCGRGKVQHVQTAALCQLKQLNLPLAPKDLNNQRKGKIPYFVKEKKSIM